MAPSTCPFHPAHLANPTSPDADWWNLAGLMKIAFQKTLGHRKRAKHQRSLGRLAAGQGKHGELLLRCGMRKQQCQEELPWGQILLIPNPNTWSWAKGKMDLRREKGQDGRTAAVVAKGVTYTDLIWAFRRWRMKPHQRTPILLANHFPNLFF